MEWSPTAQMSWYYSTFVVFWWLSAKTRANTYYEEQNKFGFCIFGAGCKRDHDHHIKRPWHEIARNLCLNMESKWRGCVFRFKHGISLARVCSGLKKCKLCWRSSRGDCTWPDCHDGDDSFLTYVPSSHSFSRCLGFSSINHSIANACLMHLYLNLSWFVPLNLNIIFSIWWTFHFQIVVSN